MERMKNYYWLILIAAIGLTSCKPMMYIQSTENVPLLKEKGEIQGSFNGSNFQGAYAITDQIGVIASAQIKNKPMSISGGTDSLSNVAGWSTESISSRNAFDLGGGIFKPLGDNAVAEVYAGGTFGNSAYEYFSTSSGSKVYSRSFKAPFAGFFIQPNIGFATDYIDIAFSTRLVGFTFSELQTSNYTTEDILYDDIYAMSGPFFMFLEPCITGKLGYKYIKGQLQIGYSTGLTNYYIRYNKVWARIGIAINIANRFNASTPATE